MRMLCSRSASLMTSTRGSRAIATIILRIVSAWAASPSFTLSILVTPSTRWVTSEPNSTVIVSSVTPVSSTVSCSRAATSVVVSMPRPGQHGGDGERMGDVRVAALALLPGVRGLGHVVGALQQREVGLRMALPVQGGQRLEDRAHDGAALAGDDAPGQPVTDPAARRAVGVARLGADVVGTADDGTVRQRRADGGRRPARRRQAAAGGVATAGSPGRAGAASAATSEATATPSGARRDDPLHASRADRPQEPGRGGVSPGQVVQSEWTTCGAIRWRPPRAASSMITETAVTTPPACSTSAMVAPRVPPVASTSSTISTR